MGFGDIHGHARVDPRRPRAFGRCDSCGFTYNLRDLRKQYEWAGASIVWQGQLVCDSCYCKPQPQLKAIRLPPDPVPVKNPRPWNFNQINMPLGFTEYSMWAGGTPLNFGVVLVDQDGNPILTSTGEEILIEIGSDGVALLAQLAEMTDIPVPGNIVSYNSTIQTRQVAQQLIPADPLRSYIAIFNPCTAPMGVSTGTATLGVTPSITIAGGACLFWATAQGYGTPYTGAMTIIGDFPGTPYYAYAASQT